MMVVYYVRYTDVMVTYDNVIQLEMCAFDHCALNRKLTIPHKAHLWSSHSLIGNYILPPVHKESRFEIGHKN